ncbi:MAG TPA: hypothetical protein VFM02_00325 [Candidatus Paceibacterota bacterium]|nr:hypothetical protein [Candidatus Paceibacterota bacterium]
MAPMTGAYTKDAHALKENRRCGRGYMSEKQQTMPNSMSVNVITTFKTARGSR